MITTTAAGKLAAIFVAISDKAGFEDVCRALESGRLEMNSGVASRAAVAAGDPGCGAIIRALQDTWRQECPETSGPLIALSLRSSSQALALAMRRIPSTEIVWTGPTVPGSFLRATKAVAKEIIRSAERELLVVGYWFAAREGDDGVVRELIEEVAQGVSRGVDVTVVADERVRDGGRHNRQVLMAAWPPTVPGPRILTWHLESSDPHLKLHAKVVAADRKDALVTSANFTSHAFEANMEMGVRIMGRPAADIVGHFDLLAQARVLTPYAAEG